MFDKILVLIANAAREGVTLAGDAWHVIESLVHHNRTDIDEAEAAVINAGAAAAHAVLPVGHPLKTDFAPTVTATASAAPAEPAAAPVVQVAVTAVEPAPPPPPVAVVPEPVSAPAPAVA
jgi:hypothetical protein